MFEILRKSLATGVVTTPFPAPEAETPAWGRGRPEIDFAGWKDARPAVAACPTGALAYEDRFGTRSVTLNLGKCTFCGLCAESDPCVKMTNLRELAVQRKDDLTATAKYQVASDGSHAKFLQSSPLNVGRIVSNVRTPPSQQSSESIETIAAELKSTVHRVLGRSLHIREVDAGSCNGCEVEIVGLNSPVYDIERFGIHFVASPRHADMLLVTGPVTRNMELALRKTYDATPAPRLVVAVGACGCSGGIFGQNYASLGGVDKVIPVDVYIPGCPPNPRALLQGILLAVGRL
jgi:Ni,Fe-hydrogenase III small subunit/formate hydrogenlyase subunit 6/NADH:ubiquinone oxidoreductase subunit I